MNQHAWIGFDKKLIWTKKNNYLATISIRGITRDYKLILVIKSECHESFRQMDQWKKRRRTSPPGSYRMMVMEQEKRKSKPKELASEMYLERNETITIDLNYETLDITFLDIRNRAAYLAIDTYTVTDIALI